jgi:hypothetical protein
MPKFLKFSYLMQVQMPCIKKIRKSQLRITYTLLYHLGLRLNEIRLEIQDILQGIERQELITLFKTNRSHNATLSSCAVEDLKN